MNKLKNEQNKTMLNFELCLTWCNLHFMPTEDLLPPVSTSEYPNGDQGTDGFTFN